MGAGAGGSVCTTRAPARSRPTHPLETVGLYVCGITPYDATHLGHAATYLAFDLAIRAWRAAGHQVRYVQNVTDVDDPLLERATATGEDWRALAERETQLFREDMVALSVIPPDHYIGAVEAIPIIVSLVERLQAQGAVYEVEGDTSTSRSRRTRRSARCRGSTATRCSLRSPSVAVTPSVPASVTRSTACSGESSSDRGSRAGRPASERAGRAGTSRCSAIAMHYLEHAFDIQGGGSDLSFPHHEMSASHAQVAFPEGPFAKGYAHAGMVGYQGHKMSKSRGNLVKVSVLREQGVDPRAIRLALLAQHYRSDWEWTDELLETAVRRLDTWSAAVRRGGLDPVPVVAAVREAMSHDLDGPAALDAVDAWAAASTGDVVEGSGALVAAVVEASLGIALPLTD